MRRFFSGLLLVVGILFSARTAMAVYQCGPKKDDCQCGANNPFPCCDNGGNCTWWGWEAACCNWGDVWGKGHVVHGNAKDWLNEAKAAGWPTGKTPVEGCIFVRTVGGNGYGHVGWVYKVYSDGSFDSSEMSCWGWYGVKKNHHSAGYAQGFIYKKGTAPPTCNTNIHHSGETVIDDTNLCFERHGPSSSWWEAAYGYGKHMWFTYADKTANPENWAMWRLHVVDAGYYDVYVFIPDHDAYSKKTTYLINHDGRTDSVKLDQSIYSNKFVKLGTFRFSKSNSQYIRLNDNTGEAYSTYKRKIGFDAIKLKAVCKPHVRKKCYNSDVYWYDSCGNRQEKVDECSDGNACTDDGCSNAQCYHKNNTRTCDDSDPCTVNDRCSAGKCVGQPKDCSALDDQCNTGVCDAGNCVQKPREGQCDDSDPCTVDDQCSAGKCVGQPKDCSALDDQCNTGVCDAGNCVQKPHDGQCDDSDPCTVDDQCSAGKCVGQPKDCDDGLDCTEDSCDPDKGCVHKPLEGFCNNDRDCTDNDPCTDDTCKDNCCIHTQVEGCCVDNSGCEPPMQCINHTCVAVTADVQQADDADVDAADAQEASVDNDTKLHEAGKVDTGNNSTTTDTQTSDQQANPLDTFGQDSVDQAQQTQDSKAGHGATDQMGWDVNPMDTGTGPKASPSGGCQQSNQPSGSWLLMLLFLTIGLIVRKKGRRSN